MCFIFIHVDYSNWPFCIEATVCKNNYCSKMIFDKKIQGLKLYASLDSCFRKCVHAYIICFCPFFCFFEGRKCRCNSDLCIQKMDSTCELKAPNAYCLATKVIENGKPYLVLKCENHVYGIVDHPISCSTIRGSFTAACCNHTDYCNEDLYVPDPEKPPTPTPVREYTFIMSWKEFDIYFYKIWPFLFLYSYVCLTYMFYSLKMQ